MIWMREKRIERGEIGCELKTYNRFRHQKKLCGRDKWGSTLIIDGQCWGEGEDVTLRSRPSLWSSVQQRQDNGRRHPSPHTTSDEDLRRGHPTVRPRPAQRPTCDPAHCNGPCVAAACYRPNL
jgi:hypothetical protein